MVSIRSPHKSKGRPVWVNCTSPTSKRFNPLPSQKQGETLPKHRKRRPYTVSIRSPHKSKGRPRVNLCCCAGDAFQSAPLTKARGDHIRNTPTNGVFGFNPLPSQKQGETRAPAPLVLPLQVSIRSPHKSKGRQEEFWQEYRQLKGFNPLPSQKQGETA